MKGSFLLKESVVPLSLLSLSVFFLRGLTTFEKMLRSDKNGFFIIQIIMRSDDSITLDKLF